MDSHGFTQRLDSVVEIMVSTNVDELSLHVFEQEFRLAVQAFAVSVLLEAR